MYVLYVKNTAAPTTMSLAMRAATGLGWAGQLTADAKDAKRIPTGQCYADTDDGGTSEKGFGF